ncbi:MAG TPA: GNAT family N-acetyltransferase, partial [Gammaproteobacteria bacterium]
MNRSRNGLVCSDDKSRFDIATVHGWIASSYWARNIPRAVFERAISGSDCFGVYNGERQIAFARVVTDRATFAYLCDVIVDETVRGRGVGAWLMECIHAHEAYQDLRRWMLATR